MRVIAEKLENESTELDYYGDWFGIYSNITRTEEAL